MLQAIEVEAQPILQDLAWLHGQQSAESPRPERWRFAREKTPAVRARRRHHRP